VDRITRHELKTDHFAQEVVHTVEFLGTHKSQVQRYGIIASVVLALIAGGWGWMRYRQNVRQKELSEMFRVLGSLVSPTPRPGMLNFQTKEAQDAAIEKALLEMATKNAGTNEGAVANYYIAVRAADTGNLAVAQKNFEAVVAEGETQFRSLAQLSLAEVYASQGKTNEAEKLLRGLMEKPTAVVSKEQATVSLARLLMNSKPEESRKLLEPLRTQGGGVGRVAITLLAEIPTKK
jgi:predicted negative regulator of RcsB-dependent stress response